MNGQTMTRTWGGYVLAGYAVAMLLASGCSPHPCKNPDGYYFQDFDNLQFWARDQAVTDANAMSGSYSAFTDSTVRFSQTFEMDMATVYANRYKSLRFTAWCYMEDDDSKASVVFSVQGPDGMRDYKSFDLKSFLPGAGTWGRLNAYFYLTSKAFPGDKLRIYLHAWTGQKAYMDDVAIQFEK